MILGLLRSAKASEGGVTAKDVEQEGGIQRDGVCGTSVVKYTFLATAIHRRPMGFGRGRNFVA
jgi:hypothetical protein